MPYLNLICLICRVFLLWPSRQILRRSSGGWHHRLRASESAELHRATAVSYLSRCDQETLPRAVPQTRAPEPAVQPRPGSVHAVHHAAGFVQSRDWHEMLSSRVMYCYRASSQPACRHAARRKWIDNLLLSGGMMYLLVTLDGEPDASHHAIQ